MLLGTLQTLLADIYAIDVAEDVHDFLVTDQRFAKHMLGANQYLEDEMLLIHEGEECCDVSLYLNEQLLGRLGEADPRTELHGDNLDDYCRVLEGVSHFVYLAWRAGNDQAVTRLELEMQAEVDKYLSARLLLESQGEGCLRSTELLNRLFAEVQYHAHLCHEDLERYQRANAMASRYCNHLEQRYPQPRVSRSMVDEVRDFYRMSQPEMLSHIHSAQFAL